MTAKSLSALVAAAGIVLGLCGSASAQKYPERPVKVVIAFSPSGAIDILGRFIADKLSQMWGQSVFVENRPGGSGNIGAAAASAAPPDGYTLHFGAQTLAVNVTLSPATAFDPVNSFDPIILVASSREVFQVSAVTPFQSVHEVVAHAKTNPGKLNYYSVGIGSTSHLSTVLFMDVTGTQMQHVPYSQMSQGMNDLISGRTEISFGPMGSSVPNIRSGKMRALAISGLDRAKLLPEIPTLTEVGVKMSEEFELVWFLRAQGHAEGDHRQGQQRRAGRHRHARHAGARGATRLPLHRRIAGQARHLPKVRDRQMGRPREEGRVRSKVMSTAADEEDIRQIEMHFNEAWNRHDPEGMVEALAEDGQFVTVNGVWMKTRAEFLGLMQRLHGESGPFRTSTRETLEAQVRFLAPGVAMVHSRFRVSGDINEDGKAVAREGVGIRVVRKQDGRWQTVAVQNTDIKNRRL